ncbi:MAG: HAD family hydrolase [Candidatus Levybacteria bacterium]|nr:HAD family hydrolase [Candidatus Levybacteria bacterium]
MTYLKVDNLFTNITTADPDIRKPNPEVFRQIVASFGVPAENVISIGDQHYSDIIPAKSIGMKGIIVGQKLESADVRIDSIQDLVPTLQTFGWI